LRDKDSGRGLWCQNQDHGAGQGLQNQGQDLGLELQGSCRAGTVYLAFEVKATTMD